MRFLFTVPPFAGHVYPLVSISAELQRRGHEIAWVSHERLADILPSSARLYGFASPGLEDDLRTLLSRSAQRWLSGLKVIWEDVIVPIANDMLPVALEAARDFQPDAVIADEIAPAGGIIAQKLGIPWGSSASTGWLHSREVDRLPKVRQWIDDRLWELYASAGVDAEPLQVSSDLVLLYTSRALAGEQADYPDHYRFVGPLHSERRAVREFPWERLSDGKIVFASAGTLYREQGKVLLRTVAEALAGEPLQVVMVGNADVLEHVPPNVLLVEWVPQLELLPRVDAVITQGGITVEEALSFGLPLVVAPIAQDQFVLADQVVRSGAGIRLRSDRATVKQVRDAVHAVLEEPGYREAAQHIQRSFADLGGVPEAADAIEILALDESSRSGRTSKSA